MPHAGVQLGDPREACLSGRGPRFPHAGQRIKGWEGASERRGPGGPGVDVAPVFQALIRLTVLDSLLEGLGINGLAPQRAQGGVGRTIGVEQTLPRRNEGGAPWADAPAEGPEPVFIDMAGFAPLDGEEL